MLFLKQSTASQSVLLGPFVDDTDGASPETGLTIANTDIRLSKNGGNMAAKNSGGGTHDENGWYTITLDATDTDTVGSLQVSCKVAGALTVFAEFQVLEEDIYDALFGASAAGFDSNQRVDVGSVLGTAQTAGDLAALVTTVDTVVDGIQTDLDNGTDGLGALKTLIDTLDTVADAIKAVTDNLPDSGALTSIATAAALTTVDTVVDAIKVVTDKLDAAHSEPTGVPAANETPIDKLGYLYMALRNRVDVTATKKIFYDDGGTAEWEKDLSDDGTTYSESEGNAI